MPNFLSLVCVYILPRALYLPSLTSDYSTIYILFVNIFLVQSLVPVPSVFFAFNAVSWSVSAEAIFYAFFPLIKRLKRFKLLLFFLVTLFISLLGALVVSIYQMPGFSQVNLELPVWEGFVYINPLFRMVEFVIGIIAANIYLAVFNCSYYRKTLLYSRFRSLIYSSIEILLFVYACFRAFQGTSVSLPVPLKLAVDQLNSAIWFSILIIICSLSSRILKRILVNKLFVFMGEISFGLYLFHQPVMIRAAQVGGFKVYNYEVLGNNIVSVTIWSVLLSIISYFALEKPFQAFLRPKS